MGPGVKPVDTFDTSCPPLVSLQPDFSLSLYLPSAASERTPWQPQPPVRYFRVSTSLLAAARSLTARRPSESRGVFAEMAHQVRRAVCALRHVQSPHRLQ